MYWSKSGRTLATATVFVGYLIGWPATMRPFIGLIGFPIGRHERGAKPVVVDLRARDVRLDDLRAGALAALDGGVDIRNRGFLELEPAACCEGRGRSAREQRRGEREHG